MSGNPPAGTSSAITFGSFRFFPARRQLLQGERPVPLGSRAVDILAALISRPGEIVTKEELTAAAWPHTFVEDSNLRIHVAGIRRALGDGQAGESYVKTIPGRGYCFVTPVGRSSIAAATPGPVPEASNIGHLPPPLARLIGRSDLVATLSAQLPHRRFSTLVGPAGIGKTTVALAVAHELAPSYPDGAALIDLAPVRDPALVTGAMAAALGLSAPSTDERASLIAFLRDKRVLLVLDNCEHVIDIAAEISEEIYRTAPGVHILATSREPLRSRGENVHRLPPLQVPPVSEHLTVGDAMRYGGVELFVERARASADSFELNDTDALVVADICRQLDGIALAIELAASRVDAFGLHELATQLDNRLGLLMPGRRTAPQRHRTLTAALDWSYRLLTETESTVLRRIAVFMGSFDLDGASAVTGDGISEPMITVLAALAQKSLAVVELSGEAVHFRLLNTMRLYAFDRLTECGEVAEVRRRHAEYHRDLFARARSEWETEPTAAWLAAYRHRIDDLRAVLDWAFSTDGDADLGLALTVDAVPLWLQLSLMQELRQRVETAMPLVTPPATANPRLRMRLSTARSLSRMYAGDPISDVNAAWSETLELAEQVGDPDYQLRALWGLFAGNFNTGNYREALRLAQRFRDLADRPADRQIGERLIGTALHYLGDQQTARVHIERMIAEYSPPAQSSHIIRYQNDQIVAARRVLAPVLWLQGFPDQAMRMTEDAVRDAAALGHALTLCNLLAQSACPLALLAGDLAVAQRFTAMLLEQSSRYSFDVWHAYGRGFEACTLIKQGDFDNGLTLLSNAANDLSESGFMQYYTQHLAALADGFARAGKIEDGLAAIEKALDRVEITEERWCLPELLRIKSELLLQQETDGAPMLAEQQFRQSLEWADRQQALSWQLRTATSLARLLRAQGRAEEARQLLSAIYARFSEGFDTQDLKAAKQVLDDLG